MKEITKYISNNGGFATMQELKDANFHTRDIAKLVKENS